MVTQTTKVKNGRILLPLKVRKNWKGTEVFLRVSDETIVIKKIKKAPFWETWDKARKIGGGINEKDIKAAIAWARKSQK